MLTLTSDAFEDGGRIPLQYACDGDDISPPLAIGGVPPGTKSLALLMEDPDVPAELRGEPFDHWVLFNIPPGTSRIPPGVSAGIVGSASSGRAEYVGPCPPSGYEPAEHRYVFTLMALDQKLDLGMGAYKDEVLEVAEGHVIARAQLVGRYKKNDAEFSR